jgi:hypothetical protein
MTERTDSMGRWESTDGGATWSLVEPSAEFEARRAIAAAPPATDPELEARLAALGAALLAQPELLDQLVANIAGSNTARGPLEYINEAVQTAAQVDVG